MLLAGVLLHPLERLDWLHWSIHPSTALGIAALGGVYWWRARRGTGNRGLGTGGSRSSSQFPVPSSPTAGQRLSFAAGLAVLFASLNGPVHDLSDTYLFSAHMVQHLMLTMVVVPLLIAGTPGWMFRPALRYPAVGAAARTLTRPAVGFVAFNLTLALWHVPVLYDLAMRHHPLHIAQHVSFLVAATLMWWPLLSPLPELPRLSYPKQMLYTFLQSLPMALIGIVITYADALLYPAYQAAPRIVGLSPREDQLVGGLIMWIPGGLIFLGVLTSVFFRWAACQSDDTASAQVGWRAMS
jgi:putative membrane protein